MNVQISDFNLHLENPTVNSTAYDDQFGNTGPVMDEESTFGSAGVVRRRNRGRVEVYAIHNMAPESGSQSQQEEDTFPVNLHYKEGRPEHLRNSQS